MNAGIPYIPPEERYALDLAKEQDLWVAPVACGLVATPEQTHIVVLHPGTREIALTAEILGRFDGTQVDGWFEEASTRFLSPLCCAVEYTTAPLALLDHIPTGNCFWVRYATVDGSEKYPRPHYPLTPAKKTSRRTHPNLRKAYALAQQLQCDFDDVEAFHHELYYLSFLQDSVKRLRCILHNRFPPDLRKVTRFHHGAKF